LTLEVVSEEQHFTDGCSDGSGVSEFLKGANDAVSSNKDSMVVPISPLKK
jgi:hypothetical protein